MDERTPRPRRSRSPLLARIAGFTLLVGWAPLLLYLPYDALRGGGGNPIGLGLLMMASTVLAGGILGFELVRQTWLRWQRRRGAPPGGVAR